MPAKSYWNIQSKTQGDANTVIESLYTYRCKERLARAIESADLSEPLRLLGRGSGRLCYQHPGDQALCIKIPRNARGRNESRREYRYIRLINLLHKESTENRVSRFYGRICTTEGVGWVVEKVLAEDGVSIAPLLHECLTPMAFEQEEENWRRAFQDFMNWCFTTAIVVRDASVNNICVKRLPDGQIRFVLIDGIGPKGSLPQWLPIKRYAHKRNRMHAEVSEFISLENLVSFCEKLRANQQFHRDSLVSVPEEPVYCLASAS